MSTINDNDFKVDLGEEKGMFVELDEDGIGQTKADTPIQGNGTYDAAKFERFVERVEAPKIQLKIIQQMSAIPYTFEVSVSEQIRSFLDKKGKKSDSAIAEKVAKANKIIRNVNFHNNWNKIGWDLEEQLTTNGNGTVVYDHVNDLEFSVYVPTDTITMLDPRTGELIFLIIIRYVTAGDIVNIITETRTKKETKFEFKSMGEGGVAPTQMSKDQLDAMEDVSEEEFKKKNKEYEDEDFTTKPNKDGFIHAQYFENLPTQDRKGRPDLDLSDDNLLIYGIDNTFERLQWEMHFNKSKFIISEEMGTSFMNNSAQQYQNMVDNDFVVMQNDFNRPVGDAQSGFQYFETNNQNINNLTFLLDKYLKMFWEQSGAHRASDDQQGKNITDYGSKLEREAPVLRQASKVVHRVHGWRRLLWKLFISALGKSYADKGFEFDNIQVIINPFKVIDEKEQIINEIIKMHANITTGAAAVKAVSQSNLTKEESEIIFANNLEANNAAIKKQMEPLPIQPSQDPSMSNPQGATKGDNKQKEAFANQPKK